MAGFSRGATPCVVGLLGGFQKAPNSAVGPRPDTSQLTLKRPFYSKIAPKNPQIVNFLRYAFKSSEVIMVL
jgi:hypothetical protein